MPVHQNKASTEHQIYDVNDNYSLLQRSFLRSCRADGRSERTIDPRLKHNRPSVVPEKAKCDGKSSAISCLFGGLCINRDSYEEGTRLFREFLISQGMPTEVEAITREHVQEWMIYLQTGVSPRTGQRYSSSTPANRFRSLHRFFEWLLEEGEIARSPMERMKAPKPTKKPVPIVRPDEMKKLLTACAGTSFIDYRDTAILYLLYDAGVRREEMGTLKVSHIDLDRGTIMVHGKGNKVRIIALGKKPIKALDKYLCSAPRELDTEDSQYRMIVQD